MEADGYIIGLASRASISQAHAFKRSSQSIHDLGHNTLAVQFHIQSLNFKYGKNVEISVTLKEANIKWEYLGCILSIAKLKGGNRGGSSIVFFPFSIPPQNLNIPNVIYWMLVPHEVCMLKP